MTLGTHLGAARKTSGLSQEAVAEQLGVSRQTISKWELGETLPDIRQAKHLAHLYHLTLDALIDFDFEVEAIQTAIEKTSDETVKKVDWTKAWGQKYPVLKTYQATVASAPYAQALTDLLDQLQAAYGYSRVDALLVLKDILGKVWQKH
ncbi:helix-turn-helix transcriptional regulator [Lacticaseibacillus daqingensis]|uniref:helix-turn-helix transcriptional regulator n=1 Tax=Lacticaseibacillus daqingensis TaxID=2486014 RepID=UPI000F7B1188|nr:helix-turn-helix transcriptional regulator [Lacticaseibacillus daqingensis]